MGLIQKAFGDIITFSRASNATRIGPNGLVQYAPHNLALQSQTFDNASWNTGNGSVTANSIAAPDGSVTADKFSEDSATGEHFIYQAASFTVGNVNTFSIYIKAAERSVVRLSAGSTARWDARAFFDVLSGTVTSVVNGSASIQSVGNGWYRCVLTGSVLTTGSTNVEINLGSSGTTIVYAGTTGSGIYLWGAQLSVGSVPGDYTPTTTAAVYGPRFDFDPVTLAARGLLIEEQRTNLATYSEDWSNAEWTKNEGTIAANTIVSPDGTSNADVFTGNGSDGYVRQLSAGAAAGDYTASVWAKVPSGTKTVRLGITDGVGTNINNTSITLTTSWQRFTLTVNRASTGVGMYVGGFSTITSGDVIHLWGAQLEAGSFATSYIPTVASTVTRSADVASVNTLSPWFNATEGTLYTESVSQGNNRIAWLHNTSTGTYDNFLYSVLISGFNARSEVNVSGVNQANMITANVASASATAKISFCYKANDFAVCLNAGAVVTDTSGSIPTVNRLQIGWHTDNVYLNGHIRRLAYYPRRLTNAELQALTA